MWNRHLTQLEEAEKKKLPNPTMLNTLSNRSTKRTHQISKFNFGRLWCYGALPPNNRYDLWIQSGINLLFYYSRAVRWFPCSSKIHQFEMLNGFSFISCVCSIVSWNGKMSPATTGTTWTKGEKKIRFNCAQQLNVSRILSISFFFFFIFFFFHCFLYLANDEKYMRSERRRREIIKIKHNSA